MQVEVTQEDRESAASAYYAWISSNPVIPRKMTAGDADGHSMVQAFARHRQAAERRALERAVKELRMTFLMNMETPNVEWIAGFEDALRALEEAL